MGGSDEDYPMIKEKVVTYLALARYLSAAGHKLHSMRPDQKKFAFIFLDSEALEKDILSYYNRTARVDPLTFAEIFRNLKALVLRN